MSNKQITRITTFHNWDDDHVCTVAQHNDDSCDLIDTPTHEFVAKFKGDGLVDIKDEKFDDGLRITTHTFKNGNQQVLERYNKYIADRKQKHSKMVFIYAQPKRSIRSGIIYGVVFAGALLGYNYWFNMVLNNRNHY